MKNFWYVYSLTFLSIFTFVSIPLLLIPLDFHFLEYSLCHCFQIKKKKKALECSAKYQLFKPLVKLILMFANDCGVSLTEVLQIQTENSQLLVIQVNSLLTIHDLKQTINNREFRRQPQTFELIQSATIHFSGTPLCF